MLHGREPKNLMNIASIKRHFWIHISLGRRQLRRLRKTVQISSGVKRGEIAENKPYYDYYYFAKVQKTV